MPLPPYDPVILVLNIVHERVGDDMDSLLPLGGQLAANSQATSQQMVNAAWRKLQQFLLSQGYVRLSIPNFIIPNLGPVFSEDAALQVTLDWTGYFDGNSLDATKALPQNFIRPMALAERPTDAAPNINSFIDIDLQNITRVPSIPKQQWNQIAVWNGDNISMPGALVNTDLRVDYAAYLSDFEDTGDVTTAVGFTPWFEQPVPIMRAADPLACFILAEIEIARGNEQAAIEYTQAGQDGATTAIIGKATS